MVRIECKRFIANPFLKFMYTYMIYKPMYIFYIFNSTPTTIVLVYYYKVT